MFKNRLQNVGLAGSGQNSDRRSLLAPATKGNGDTTESTLLGPLHGKGRYRSQSEGTGNLSIALDDFSGVNSSTKHGSRQSPTSSPSNRSAWLTALGLGRRASSPLSLDPILPGGGYVLPRTRVVPNAASNSTNGLPAVASSPLSSKPTRAVEAPLRLRLRGQQAVKVIKELQEREQKAEAQSLLRYTAQKHLAKLNRLPHQGGVDATPCAATINPSEPVSHDLGRQGSGGSGSDDLSVSKQCSRSFTKVASVTASLPLLPVRCFSVAPEDSKPLDKRPPERLSSLQISDHTVSENTTTGSRVFHKVMIEMART